jgi:putative PIG3 family NAD(P)H quinone oxidoreductase
MKAIMYQHHGGPEVLRPQTIPKPTPNPNELLVRVFAVAVNRTDIAQRRGLHIPPEGHSEILGLEIAGEVVGKGKNVKKFQKGDRIFGLVDGGGYAEFCVIDEDMALPIPDHWSYEYAASIPEAFITADETLFQLGTLKKGETVLIHAGGGGVGSVSIQLAHHIGARVYTTAGSDEKITKAMELGAHIGINYHTHDFAYHIQTLTNNEGVDVVQDFIGAKYLARNINCLKDGGRLVLVSLLDGPRTDINLTQILTKHLHIRGTLIRNLSPANKREVINRFYERWFPKLKTGILKPIIDYVFPWELVQEAHKHIEMNRNFGKIVLKVR